MTTITLAKALKTKNRQIQKVSDLRERIQGCNSYLAGSDPDFDANALFAELKAETEKLWRLKAAINRANEPVSDVIYEMSETKGMIAFVKQINTQRGKAVVGYMQMAAQDFNAQITAAEVLAEVEALEKRADEIQDLLDAHNARTTLTFEE